MKARPEAEDSESSPGETAQVRGSLLRRARALIQTLRDADEGVAAEVVSNWSRSRRLLGPLALAVGGIEMLFSGVRILVSNWRLLLVQVLPVLVVWWALYDLKA